MQSRVQQAQGIYVAMELPPALLLPSAAAAASAIVYIGGAAVLWFVCRFMSASSKLIKCTIAFRFVYALRSHFIAAPVSTTTAIHGLW